MSIIEFEVFRDYLGVDATDPEVDDASKLYDAIGASIKRLTHRDFEGDEGATYTEQIRLFGAQEFSLRHVPVEAVISVAKLYFDGTLDAPYETDRWRIENAATGRIRLLRRSPEYIQVAYRTTGEIPADLPWAYLEWGKTRWAERGRDPALLSYRTGEDSETYRERIAGGPPGEVALAIYGNRHETGGGVV